MIHSFPISWFGALLLATATASFGTELPPPVAAAARPSPTSSGSSSTAAASKIPGNPSELYTRLSAVTRPQWRKLYRPTVTRCLDGRQQAAMGLGAVTADLFLAAQARDTQQIRNLIQDEETIEKTLGLIMPMAERRTEMLSAAESSDWPALVKAIDRLTAAHRRHFRDHKDESLAELAYIGEWMRTLQICHAVTIQKELTDYRLAIGSPALILEMNRRLTKLGGGNADASHCLKLLNKRLNGLSRLWPEGEHTFPNLPDRLQRSSDLLSDTVGQLLQEDPPASQPPSNPGTISASER